MPQHFVNKLKKEPLYEAFFILPFTQSKKNDKFVYYFKTNTIFKNRQMKRIVIKEIDKLKSTLNKGKVVSEYLIYLTLKDGDGDIILKGFTELGEENKKSRVNQLIAEYFLSSESLSSSNINDIIQEVSFEENKNKTKTRWKTNTH